MRSLSSRPLLLLLVPGFLFAQNNQGNIPPGTRDSAGTVYKVPSALRPESDDRYKLTAHSLLQFEKSQPPSADACPVSLRAQRQGTAAIYRAGDPSQDRTPAAQLEITFFNGYAKNVVSAVIKVHGSDGSVQMMPADPIRRAPHDLTRTIELNLSVLGRQSASTELTMRKLGTVSRIEVESVEFADGTNWKAAEPGMCSYAPELYMLVGAR